MIISFYKSYNKILTYTEDVMTDSVCRAIPTGGIDVIRQRGGGHIVLVRSLQL